MMEELQETPKAKIEAHDSLDARALNRRYAAIVADVPNCALSSVVRATETTTQTIALLALLLEGVMERIHPHLWS